MANRSSSLLDSVWATPHQTTPLQVGSPVVDAKKASVELSAAAKKALFGAPEEQRVAATAIQQGNELAEERDIANLRNLSQQELSALYGPEVAENRYRLYEPGQELRRLKDAERDGLGVARDTALDLGVAAAGIIGGTAAAAVTPADMLLGTNMAGGVAKGLDWTRESAQGLQTDLMQERRAQHQLEGMLDAQDSEAQYQRDLEANASKETSWERSVQPWFEKQGRDFMDAITNYGDDPMMLGSLGAEAAGSMLPVAGQLRAIGAARAMTVARSTGRSADEAAAFLRTDAGRELVRRESERAAPFVIGAAESGSAINETQMRIFEMGEDELQQSPDYRALREQGMSHEEAQGELARSAGMQAGAFALPGALAAGKIAAPFASNPLFTGSRGGVRGAAGNILREGAEETIQEGNAQFASNLAMNTGAGLDVALDEGVAAGAAQGLLGGVMSGGTFQAPGLVSDVASDTAERVGEVWKSVLDTRADQAAEAAGVGPKAQGDAVEAFTRIAMAEPVPTEAVLEQAPETVQLRSSIQEAALLSEADEADRREAYPELQAQERRLTRFDAISAASKVLMDPQNDVDPLQAALDIIYDHDQLRRVDNDATAALSEGLAEDDQLRLDHDTVRKQLQVIEANPAFERARQVLMSITPEVVEENFRPMLQDPVLSVEEKDAVVRAIETIGRVNPQAVGLELYDEALDQVRAGGMGSTRRTKVLKSLKSIAQQFTRASEEKAAIEEDQQTEIQSMDEAVQERLKARSMKTVDIVRQEIEVDGNSDNNMPSLIQHNALVSDAMAVGRFTEAADALTELRNFGESQINKLEALNTSAANGGTSVPYMAYSPQRRFFQSDAGMTVHLNQPPSVAFAREVQVDAESVASLYNSLLEAYGDQLDLSKGALSKGALVVPELVRSVKRKARQQRLIASVDPAVEERLEALETTPNQPEAVQTGSDPIPVVRFRPKQMMPKARRQPAGRSRRELLKDAGGNKPFISFLMERGGIREGSELHDELTSAGIQKRDIPGLIRADEGAKSADQIDIGGTEIPWLIGTDETGYYLTTDLVMSSIADEISGTPRPVSADQVAAREELDAIAEEDARIAVAQDAASVSVEEAPDEEASDDQAGMENASEPVEEQTPETAEEETRESDQEATEQDAADGNDGDRVDAARAVELWFNGAREFLVRVKDGINHFVENFRPRQSNTSTFTAVEDPAAFLQEAFGDASLEVARFGRDLEPEERDALGEVLGDLLPKFTDVMEKQMFALLTKPRKKSKANPNGLTLKDQLEKEGRDILGYKNLRPLNFIQEMDGDRVVLDPHAVQATFMAAMEWVMSNTSRPSWMDNDDVAELFGLPRGSYVTKDMRTIAQFGDQLQSVVAPMADRIMLLLGVSPKSDAQLDEAQGMFRAMASNAVRFLIEEQILEVNRNEDGGMGQKVKVPVSKANPDGYRTMVMIRANMDDGTKKDLLRRLEGMRDGFAKAFGLNNDRQRYIGEAPTRIEKTQLGNRLTRLSKVEEKVVERLQNQAHYVNKPMVDLLDAMGDRVWQELLGWRPLTDSTRQRMNKVKVATQEGKNQSLERAVYETRSYVRAATALGEDTPIYFQWRVSSVGRLQQMGPITPQGDKTAREMITATWSTLDLLENNSEQLDVLWLAIAQSVGIGIEKMTRESSIQKATEVMGNELAPAVALMETWLETGELDGQALKAALEASGQEVTAKLIHATLTVAQLNKAARSGEEAMRNFRTALAIEADGKTDGPINAMLHMGVGEFSPREIERFAKGGLFFTSQEMSLNQFIKHENRQAEDLYTMAAKLMEKRLALRLQDAETAQKMLPMLKVMDAFLPNFSMSLKEGRVENFSIKRNLTKNPLTVFLYGSGEDGIAGKLVSNMMDEIYEMLSELAAGVADGTMRTPGDHPLFQNDPGLYDAMVEVMGRETARGLLLNPTEGELTEAQEKQLITVMRESFSDLMLDVINETTGGLAFNMKETQKAAAAQAYVFQDLFAHALERRREDLGVDFLSQDDIEDVFRETMDIAPIYETGAQSFHIAGPERETSTDSISESLWGDLSSRATGMRPSDPSVKVSPYLTIGTGDARMMLNIYLNSDGSLTPSLAVFDGVELALDQAVAGSRQINASVFQGWQDSNIYRSIAEGYKNLSQIMTDELINELEPETIGQLRRTFRLGKKEVLQARHFKSMSKTLELWADQADARKEALRAVASSTDHMASVEAPHTNAGQTTASDDPLSYEEIAELLNGYYNDALKKIQDARKDDAAKPVVQEPTEELRTLVLGMGEPVPGHPGVQQLFGDQLVAYLSYSKDIAPDVRSLVRQVLQTNSENSIYFFGEVSALEAFRNDRLKELASSRPIQLGQAYPTEGVVFIANGSPETVVHEMLHMKIFRLLRQYYSSPEGVPQYVRDAIERLERLMKRTQLIQAEENDVALMTLQDELDRLLAAGKEAAAMSEFISWMMSNQQLIEKAKKTRMYAPIARMIREGIRTVKMLLGIRSDPGETLFSNVRFNTEILLADQTEIRQELGVEIDVLEVLEQRFPAPNRLLKIEQLLLGRLRNFLNANRPASGTGEREVYDADTSERVLSTEEAVEKAIANGFSLDPRQAAAFKAIHETLISGMSLSAPLVRQMNGLFSHALQTLKVQDLMAEGESDTTVAQQRLDYLTKIEGSRQHLMARFVALGETSPMFRAALEKMPAPKRVDVQVNSVDSFLTSLVNTAVNLITNLTFRRPNQPLNVQRELDRLTDALIAVEEDRKFLAMLSIGNKLIEQGNSIAASAIEKSSKAVSEKLQSVADGIQQPRLKGAVQVAALVTSFANKEGADQTGEALTTILNHAEGWNTFRSLLSDLRGMTASNAVILRMVNRVKAQIDALRQDYREGVPEELAKRFSRPLAREEWEAMFMGFGRADLLSLGRQATFDLVRDPASVDARIAEADEQLMTFGGSFANRYRQKAEALATYMVTRENTSLNLLRNANAIAGLYNEQGSDKELIEQQVKKGGDDLLLAIGHLTSLLAFQKLDQATKDRLKALVETEQDGLEAVIGFHHHTRALELQRRDRNGENKVAALNGWKGYVPSLVAQGASLKIAEDVVEGARLIKKGYVRVGDYEDSAFEGNREKMGYYQSTVSGRNAFRQGIAQTVHESWNGVDARTGLSRTGETDSVIYGEPALRIAAKLGSQKKVDGLKPGSYPMPVLDRYGFVVAYERPLDPKHMKKIQRDQHLGRMLGVWAGRIIEEEAADQYNRELVQTLKQVWDEAKNTKRAKEFVNVASSRGLDPVYKDAWNTLGWRIKSELQEVFGQRFVPIRKDMLEDIIGFRQASITDPWTGVSRWNPKFKKAFQSFATGMMGNKAYANLRKGEDFVGSVVSYLKTNIIVRSMVVGASNLLSNVVHLMMRGVGPIEAMIQMREKFLEITQFVKNREDIQKLRIDLSTALGRNADKENRIRAQIQSLEDANARLSIKPLLEAGEFSTISEDLTEADTAIREGRWADWMETATNKLPGWSSTVAKNVLITKDTALFKGLNRMVQYGDFIAKAVLFDHLKSEGMSEREALDVVLEEFVQYNRLAGRGRDYLESMGLLWFWNYKLRIQKVAVNALRERPLSALMMMGGVGPLSDVDTVLPSSLAGTVADGSVLYSLGPQMGLSGVTLHPAWNLWN